MSLRQMTVAARIAAAVLAMTAVTGCSGTSTGNPRTDPGQGTTSRMTLKFDGSGAQPSPTPSPSPSPQLLPSVGVSDVLFCYSQVVFTSGSGVKTTLPFAVGAFGFGATLGTVDLNPGTYTGIELVLSSGCSSGNSVQFSGPLGPMATAENVTLTFPFTFAQTNADSVITLRSQPFADALAAVTLPTQIAPALEAVSGTVEGVLLAERAMPRSTSASRSPASVPRQGYSLPAALFKGAVSP